MRHIPTHDLEYCTQTAYICMYFILVSVCVNVRACAVEYIAV